MTVSKIEHYTIRYAATGITEENVLGSVWAIGPDEHYFDRYTGDNRDNWVTRFNEAYGQSATSNKDIKLAIGLDNLHEFKIKYVRTHFPRIDRFICLD